MKNIITRPFEAGEHGNGLGSPTVWTYSKIVLSTISEWTYNASMSRRISTRRMRREWIFTCRRGIVASHHKSIARFRALAVDYACFCANYSTNRVRLSSRLEQLSYYPFHPSCLTASYTPAIIAAMTFAHCGWSCQKCHFFSSSP